IGAGIAVGMHTLRREAILLDQVEDGDAPLLLDIGVAPDDRALVELDRADALLVAVGVGHDGAACKGARAKGKGRRGGYSAAGIPLPPAGGDFGRVPTIERNYPRNAPRRAWPRPSSS